MNHPTGYDREYDADDHAAFFSPFFTEGGVFAGSDAGACLVSVQSGATVKVAAGAVYARGRMCVFDGTETLAITQDNVTIVARMNKSADVRAFQLLAVTETVDTEDILDVPLAQAALTPVSGGYEVTLTDQRTFVAFTGQPPYYPPDSQDLPYILWLYTLGFPLTEEQQAAVEGNPSLLAIFNQSFGAQRNSTVTFTESSWTAAMDTDQETVLGYTITVPKASHGRQTPNFCCTVWHLVSGAYRRNTWAALCTEARYDAESGSIVLQSAEPFDGKAVFMG